MANVCTYLHNGLAQRLVNLGNRANIGRVFQLSSRQSSRGVGRFVAPSTVALFGRDQSGGLGHGEFPCCFGGTLLLQETAAAANIDGAPVLSGGKGLLWHSVNVVWVVV